MDNVQRAALAAVALLLLALACSGPEPATDPGYGRADRVGAEP